MSKELGISVQEVRTALNHLKSTSEITIKSTNKNTLITLVNFKKYQLANCKSTSKSTNKLSLNQPSINHNIRNKRNKEERNIISLSNFLEEDLDNLYEN